MLLSCCSLTERGGSKMYMTSSHSWIIRHAKYTNVLWFGYLATIWKDKLTAHLERRIPLPRPIMHQSSELLNHFFECLKTTLGLKLQKSNHRVANGTYTGTTAIRVMKNYFQQLPHPLAGSQETSDNSSNPSHILFSYFLPKFQQLSQSPT